MKKRNGPESPDGEAYTPCPLCATTTPEGARLRHWMQFASDDALAGHLKRERMAIGTIDTLTKELRRRARAKRLEQAQRESDPAKRRFFVASIDVTDPDEYERLAREHLADRPKILAGVIETTRFWRHMRDLNRDRSSTGGDRQAAASGFLRSIVGGKRADA